MDLKFKIKSSLIKYIETHPITFVQDITKNYIYNAILIAPPNLDIFKIAIDKIVDNVNKKYYGKNDLMPTGPGLLGNILYKLNYNSYVSLYLDNSVNNNLMIKDKETNNIIFESYNRKLYKSQQNVISNKPHYQHLWKKKNIYL